MARVTARKNRLQIEYRSPMLPDTAGVELKLSIPLDRIHEAKVDYVVVHDMALRTIVPGICESSMGDVLYLDVYNSSMPVVLLELIGSAGRPLWQRWLAIGVDRPEVAADLINAAAPRLTR